MLVPMYIAEISPRKLRGRLGTLWQFLIVLGIMISYWIDYACLRNLPTGHSQWRIPLAIQLAPGGILFIGMAFLPESLRWLALKGRDEDVKKNLLKLRDLPEDHPEIIEELEEINAAAAFERESKSGKWTELFQRNNLHRLFIGIMLQIFQQWTGTNAIVSINGINLLYLIINVIYRTIMHLKSLDQLVLIVMKLKFSLPVYMVSDVII